MELKPPGVFNGLLVIIAVLLFVAGCGGNMAPPMDYQKDRFNSYQERISRLGAFLSGYNWFISENACITRTFKIPETFADKPGEYPKGLYWAYSNELSRGIGLDISPYKGREVIAHICPLKEEFIDGAYRPVRAVVIEAEGMIVGAWIDYYGILGSLDRKFLGDIIKKPWGQ